MKQYSVILPVYNENEVFEELYLRLKKVMEGLRVSYEIIFVDDGSQDETFNTISRTAKNDTSVIAIKLSRNFGQDNAIIAGIKFATGKDLIFMDADLQDPPEFIPTLIEKKKEGFGVVYGIKHDRKEGTLKKILTNAFYLIMFFLSNLKIPKDAGTFSILSRSIAMQIADTPESSKFFSGLRSYVGFKQIGVPYRKEKRSKGKPKPFIDLLRMGLNAFFSFSIFPLRFTMTIAIFMFGFSCMIFCLWLFGQSLNFLPPLELIHIISFFIVSQFLLLLLAVIVICEYVGRIHAQVKKRPEYLVETLIKNGEVNNFFDSS